MVIRSTFGLEGQRRMSSFSTRAVVDFPTATEPPMPMMKGVLRTFSALKKTCLWRNRSWLASTWADSSRDSER